MTMGEESRHNPGNAASAPTGGTGPVLLRLSPPPSVNHIWNRGRGGKVYRSRAYQTWIVRNMFTTGRKVRQVPGPVSVEIHIWGGKGWRRGRDIDNVLKPLMDYLQHIEAIEDDCSDIVQSITVKFYNPQKPSDKSYIDMTVRTI